MIYFNKILGDADRIKLKSLINDMFLKCPETMAKKYPLANVQQAFILDKILELEPDKNEPMLCVGCAYDTAAEYLIAEGYNIVGIDPEINVSLSEYKKITINNFSLIFSISVIEHVEDDEQFIRDICELLNDDGIALLTCDFRETPGKVHPMDFRFYTKNDLLVRLGNIIKSYNCELIGEPKWEGEPNFSFDGCNYGFASLIFRKNESK